LAVDRFPVEAGAIMMFARAVGDPNPIYYDEAYAAGTEVGGIIAPPTFVQSSAQFDPDYPLRPKLGQPWFGSGRTPTGVVRQEGAGGRQGGGLHAEQEFTYHRPLRPGDVLSATTLAGKSWEKEGRSGKLVFSESIVEYRDQQGELVVTARGVGVKTERPVTEGRP
jgi:acyl dehydratase